MKKFRNNPSFSDVTKFGNNYFSTRKVSNNYQTGKLAKGPIEAEATRFFKNIEAVLNWYQLTFTNIVKCMVILGDI